MSRYGLLPLLLPSGLFAQSGSGILTGSVRDNSGAVVAKARVLVVNEDSGVSLPTESNDRGCIVWRH